MQFCYSNFIAFVTLQIKYFTMSIRNFQQTLSELRSDIELLFKNRKEMGCAQLTTSCYGHFVDTFFVLSQNEAKLLFWDCLLSNWQHWNQLIAFSQINNRKICWVKAVNVVEFFTVVILLINQLSSISSFTFMSL